MGFRVKKVLFSLFSFFVCAAYSQTSIFVQDPAIFHQRQVELQKLKGNLTGSTESLDSLLEQANKISKMSDRCASVSINDVMDEDCWHFFQVALPAFEAQYMKVTGEVRLGHMEMTRGLEDRKLQISACAEALSDIAFSKDQFLMLDGGVDLEPLATGFQANYDFTLKYEPEHQKQVFEIAEVWGKTCRDMVVRKDGEGFAPYFIDRLQKLNEGLASEGNSAVYKIDTTEVPTLYMDIGRPVRSAYYLNGRKLFHSRISSGGPDESNLRISFGKETVQVDGEPQVVKKGTPQKFKGSVEFSEKVGSMRGQWVWENRGNVEGVDFGPDEDEVVTAVPEEEPVPESVPPTQNKKKKALFSPWLGLTVAFAPYLDKSYRHFDIEEKALTVLPDLTGVARFRLTFGKSGDGFVAVGGGAFIGAGIVDGLQRVYVAPVAQAELGYSNVGIRETAVFAFPEDDSDEWSQFRTGVFYNIDPFGIEMGLDMIMNMGYGGYVSLYWSL